MRKLRVLVLMHPSLVPPESREGYSEKEAYAWKTEFDVVTTLRKSGHDVRPLGVQEELTPIRRAMVDWKPHIVFNLLEEFHYQQEFDQHVVSYLELLQARYTGCNPRGLVLARNKSLAKKLVHYHRVRVPRFAVVRMGRKPRLPDSLTYPLIVKCVAKEGSLGISQSSVVDSDEKLEERVRFVHERLEDHALVEEFIEGRELYVGVLGNRRIQVLPVWELVFENLSPRTQAIATEQAKHNPEYQERRGIYQQPAEGLPPELVADIERTTKRIYRNLELDGYARIDYRLKADGTLYFLEANPNPEIAESAEFASAALHTGLKYPQLLAKIISLGMARGQ
ncbi:MAG: ATP-grasp domain-containing protein [Vicinamibacterales bacterium]